MSSEFDIPGEWYYYWLIPSLISLLMSCLMIIHISLSWKTDHSLLYFHKVCLLFSFFDILQDIGLIFDMWKQHCRLQYILFLSGSLYKAFIAVGGLSGLYVIVIHHYFPNDIQLQRFACCLFGIATLVLTIMFSTDVNHELNCSKDGRENLITVNHISLKSKLIFGLTFCLFTVLCCLTVTYMSYRILYRFKSYTHFYTFRSVILLYLLIFLFAILPGCIYLINLVLLHEYQTFILEFTGLSLCSSGSLFVLSYFILIFSPKIKKLFKISHYYDQNSQIMLSSSSTSRPPSERNNISSLTKKILYYDENRWIESSSVDQCGFYPAEQQLEDSRPVSTQFTSPNQKENNFHSNLISSLYDIRIETPQHE